MLDLIGSVPPGEDRALVLACCALLDDCAPADLVATVEARLAELDSVRQELLRRETTIVRLRDAALRRAS